MGFGDDWIEQNRRTLEAARLATVRETLGGRANLHAAQASNARAESRQLQAQLEQARQQQAYAQRQASDWSRQEEARSEQIKAMAGQLYRQGCHISALEEEMAQLRTSLAAAQQAAEAGQKRQKQVLQAVRTGDLEALLRRSEPLAQRYRQTVQAQAQRLQEVYRRELESPIFWAMRNLETDEQQRFGSPEALSGLAITFYEDRLRILYDALRGEHPRLSPCLRDPWRANMVLDEYRHLRAFVLEMVGKSRWTPEVVAEIEARLPPETVEISRRYFSEPDSEPEDS